MGAPCVYRRWAGACNATVCPSSGVRTANCTQSWGPRAANAPRTTRVLLELIATTNDTINRLSALPVAASPAAAFDRAADCAVCGNPAGFLDDDDD